MRGRQLVLVVADGAVEIAEHVLHAVDMVRNLGGVARDQILLAVDLGQQLGDAAHRVFDRADRILRMDACLGAAFDLFDHLFGFIAERVDGAADFLGRLARFAGERLHLIGDDGKGAALFARAHRLDCGIECKDIGGLGNLVDFLARPANLVHRRGETGDVLRQRFDEAEEVADFVQRIADQHRPVIEPLDCAFGQQPGLVTGFEDLALVFIERGNRALQLDIFAAQVAEGIDHSLNDPCHVRTAHGYLAASCRYLVQSRRPPGIDRAEFHCLCDPLFGLVLRSLRRVG